MFATELSVDHQEGRTIDHWPPSRLRVKYSEFNNDAEQHSSPSKKSRMLLENALVETLLRLSICSRFAHAYQ
jgi:hypothetical protein